MNSLVLELQKDALDSSISVLDLLRKALLVSKKLKIKEFEIWIELELNGYGKTPVPEYRLVRGQLRALNPYHGWQPIITTPELESSFASLCNCSIYQSISELTTLGNSKNNELEFQLPFEIETTIVRLVKAKIKITISRASIQAIVELTRDVILRWVLKLEEDGIIGEGMTFSQEEKKIAANHDYSKIIQINIGQAQMQNSSSESQARAENFKNDLQGANIVNFANQVQDNAQQVASDFSQNINQNINEITRLITSLRQMAQNFPQLQREEAIVHLDDLQEDIATPKKQKLQRIRTRIVALLTIASVIAGTADFANNVLELSQKLGLQIDDIKPNPVEVLPALPLN
ncbi:hypothetical protein C7H19_18325 [Aphanothece hegewaldii CCALA 016]|uniref:AbiTii domain-containing protein n=1 Tax=Aphanothece hegewaldii CCALA 016 TaxID=2107694 RepID=A0A2T1LU53_9CHRO|nr:hypothetical protein [Aphanothece hegewaldii]PSF34961.1 hypothetical protein C7H19_18325 [Aphanothece hegewaldii CCALA 016]